MKTLTLLSLLAVAVPLSAELTSGATVPHTLSLAIVADVNGDGLSDLVEDRDVLINQGGAGFLKQSLGLAAGDLAIEWLDANGDGRADLLTHDTPANAYGSPEKLTYRVYLANAQGTFSTGKVVPHAGAFPHVAELTGDGKEDLVLSRPLFQGNRSIGTELRALVSNGDGTFTPRNAVRIPADIQFGLTDRLLAGDVDRDGHRDLMLRTPDDLTLVRGAGNGDFATPQSRFLPATPFGFWGTNLGDVDSDGNLDMIMTSQRTIRVFFGDGRGNFPRMTLAPVEKVREAVVPPWAVIFTPPNHPAFTPDVLTQPRAVALGEFLRDGRVELAAGTGEGDVVIFTYERGRLREVGRIETELLAADVYTGSFSSPGRTDLYVTWNFGYPTQRPAPRIFQAAAEPGPRSMQRREGHSFAAKPADTTTFDVQATGECVTANETWTLTRDGVFGAERTATRTVETAYEDGHLYVRMTAPWTGGTAGGVAFGTLNAIGGRRFEGTLEMETPCGWKAVAVKATMK